MDFQGMNGRDARSRLRQPWLVMKRRRIKKKFSSRLQDSLGFAAVLRNIVLGGQAGHHGCPSVSLRLH
jgi:hypothetical protein